MVRTGPETAEGETAEGEPAGLVSWRSGSFDGRTTYWEIGIALLPEYRGRGIGWRAQALLTAYLFEHTPVHRIHAATHPENVAEQKALEKAGFRLEGVVRGCEFRAGWVPVRPVARRSSTGTRQRFGDGFRHVTH
jgi:ribosomal-protein-alanine N-acetyltransferase